MVVFTLPHNYLRNLVRQKVQRNGVSCRGEPDDTKECVTAVDNLSCTSGYSGARTPKCRASNTSSRRKWAINLHIQAGAMGKQMLNKFASLTSRQRENIQTVAGNFTGKEGREDVIRPKM